MKGNFYVLVVVLIGLMLQPSSSLLGQHDFSRSRSSSTSKFGVLLGVSGNANFSKIKHEGDFKIKEDEVFNSKFGYGGGLDLGVKYGAFSLLSGFKYNTRGGQVEDRYLDEGEAFVFYDDEIILAVSPGIRFLDYKYNVFTIPLQLRAIFGNDDFKFGIKTGLNFNLIQGNFNLIESWDLTLPNVQKNFGGEVQYEFTKGIGNLDLVKKSYTSFVFSPTVMYNISDSGWLIFSLGLESSKPINNKYFYDFNSLYYENGQVSGTIKNKIVYFELGYEHNFNFEIGTKY